MWRKILRRGGIRFRLPLFGRLAVRLAQFPRLRIAVLFLVVHTVRLSRELQRRTILMNFVRNRFIRTTLGLVVGGMRVRQHLSGERLGKRRDRRNYRGVRLGAMPVVVILEVFEDVADVQEGIAVQPDIHEG